MQAWEDATDNDLVTAGDIEVGEMYDDANFTDVRNCTGATTDASNYRILRAASGQEFDPVTGTGCEWVMATNTVALVVGLAEDFFQLGPNLGFDITTTDNAVGGIVVFQTAVEGCLAERLFVKGRNSGSYNIVFYGIRCNVTPPGAAEVHPTIRNCIVVSETGTQGPIDYNYGVAASHNVFNCVSYNAGTHGFWFTSLVDTDARNNISTGSGTNDFNFGSGTPTANDYNASSDLTATGSNSITGQTDTDLFTDPANDDFTLKAGSNAIDDGVDLSGTFTDDYDGTTRSGTWDMGAYHSGAASGDVTVTPATLNVPVAVVAVAAVGGFATVAAATLDVPVAVVAIAVSDNGEIHAGTWGESQSPGHQRVFVRQQRSRTLRSVVGGSSTTGIESPADIWFQDLLWEGSDLAGLIWSRTQRDRGYYSGHIRFTRCEIDGLWDATNDLNLDGKTKWGMQMWDCPQHTIEYSTMHNIDLEHCVYQHTHGPNVTLWYHHSTFKRCGRTALQFVSRNADGDGCGAGNIQIEHNYIEDTGLTSGGGGASITFAGGLVNVDAVIDNNTIRLGMDPNLDSGVGDNITGCITTRMERFGGDDGGADGEPKTYSASGGYGLKSLTITNNTMEVGEAYGGLGGPSRMMLELKEIETLTIGSGNKIWKYDGTPDPEACRIEVYSPDNGYTGLIGQVNLTHPANMTSKGRWTFTDAAGQRTYGDLSSTDAYTLMFGWETTGGLGGPSGVCFSLGDGP
jgi:hypothetical protein